MKLIPRALGLAALVAHFSACAHSQVMDAGPEIDSGAALVALLESRAARAPLTGEASVRMLRPQKQSFNVGFLLDPPERMRADITTVFGIPLASAASDARRLTVFRYGQNHYFTGPATSPAARQLLPVPLAPAEFIALATGVPDMSGLRLVDESFAVGSQAVAANFSGDGRLVTVVVNRDTRTVRELIYNFPQSQLRIRFLGWRATKAGLLPESAVVTVGDEAEVEARLGSWKFSVEPEPEDFFIPPPPGSAIYLFGAQAPIPPGDDE